MLTRLKKFLGASDGGFALPGALLLTACAAAAFGSVAFARSYAVRAQMQSALDAAMLAAAASDAYKTPQSFVDEAMRGAVVRAAIPLTSLAVEAHYDPVAGRLSGKAAYAHGDVSWAPGLTPLFEGEVQAESAPSFNGRIEIALALDVSGSMSQKLGTGTRMDALRDAVEKMLQKIEAVDGHEDRIFVSIIPYASGVNIGAFHEAVAGGRSIFGVDLPSEAGPEPLAFFKAPASDAQRMALYYGITSGTGYASLSAQDLAPSSYEKNVVWATERLGPHAGTDAGPQAAPVEVVSANDLIGMHKSYKTTISPVLPLTSDIADVRAFMGGLTPYGGTAGHIGMEWAWYALSPEWAPLWSMTKISEEGVFAEVRTLGMGPAPAPAAYEDPEISKIIVMMTDGVFSKPVNPAAGASSAEAYAYFERVCEGAKAKKIKIFTVALSEDASTTAPLERCASDPGSFFRADTRGQLAEAFEKMSSFVSRVRLTR